MKPLPWRRYHPISIEAFLQGTHRRRTDFSASMYADRTAVALCCWLALECLREPVTIQAALLADAVENGAGVVALRAPVTTASSGKGSPSEAKSSPEAKLQAVEAGHPQGIPVPDELNAVVPSRLVTPLEVQCGAAHASSLGNLLTAEQAAGTAAGHTGRGADHTDCVRRKMLRLAAEEARNRDAGAALLLYWSLAEAFHSGPILEDAIRAADLAVDDHTTLTNRGLELGIDKAALMSRRLALEDSRVELEVAIDTLSEAIHSAAELPRSGIATIRPGADEALLDEFLDTDTLVADALTDRPELRMLRLLQANLNTDTMPVARTALAMVSPALGVAGGEKPCGLLFRCLITRENQRREMATVARQLRQLRHDREAAVVNEVRRAARECEGNAARARVARDQLEIRAQALADLGKKVPSGSSDPFSLHSAELEVATAQRQVIERLAALEKSRVSLWQAQGTLARKCGHGER